MMAKFLIIWLVIAVGLGFIYPSEATIYYMGDVGDDFQTFKEAFEDEGCMVGGDTLILRDGTYSNGVENRWCPPGGTAENYTIIKADNDGGPILTYGFSSNIDTAEPYVQLEGIKWTSSPGAAGSDHVKFLRCIFEGSSSVDGNVVAMGTSIDDVLFEDCIAYGKGRYKFLLYGVTNAIMRRCVARMDYVNGGLRDDAGSPLHEPIAAFSVYGCTNVELQNCIVIDGDTTDYWDNLATTYGGAFFTPNYGDNITVRGCIVLNFAMPGSTGVATNSNIYDTVMWDAEAGVLTNKGESVHCTVGDMYNLFHYEGGVYASDGICAGDPSNNLITEVGEALKKSLGYNSLYNNNDNGPVIESDITDVDPIYDAVGNPTGALKYLTRIEASSPLDGTAGDGGDIGATILKRIGVSGTLYGETGYNTTTSDDLWPFPNEDIIKSHMAAWNVGGTDPGLPRGDRGFANYSSPFGSPSSLTAYIWEYLGNEIPEEIYGDEGDPAPNNPPIAYAQAVVTNQNVPVSITLVSSDVDGDSLDYTVMSDPSDGVLTGTAPSLTYTPDTDYFGSDSFTFKANDDEDDSNTATVSITVNAPSGTPVAYNQSVSTDEDTPVSITLVGSDPDDDSLSYIIVSSPDDGVLTGTAPSLTYTPDDDFNGIDSFTFKVNDGSEDSNTATVSLTIDAVNDAPVASDQSVTTDEDVPASITLVGTDVDDDDIVYTIASSPSDGSLTGTAPNLIYTPDADFTGSDSFTFNVNDGEYVSNTGTVTITVEVASEPVVDPSYGDEVAIQQRGSSVYMRHGYQTLREEAILTTKYVSSDSIRLTTYNDIGVFFSIDKGSLTSFQYKVQWSPDGDTWYDEVVETIAAGLITDIVCSYTYVLSDDVVLYKLFPYRGNYFRVRVKGTGTVTSSSCAVYLEVLN